jgi:cell division protein ZipA
MDLFEPKTVLIAVALMVFLAIVLDLLRRRKRNRYENLQMSSRELDRTSRSDPEEDPFAQSQFPSGRSRVVETRDNNTTHSQEINDVPKAESSSSFKFTSDTSFESSLLKEPEQGALALNTDDTADGVTAEPTEGGTKKIASDSGTDVDDVLVIHLMADKGQTCSGKLLKDAVFSLGLRYGDMKIFHRHSEEDGSGPVLFSMANLLNPGTFDLNTMGDMQAVGVTLFMTPNELEEPVDALDLMLETAEKLAQQLQLTVKDESRSSMTKQTIDHYRQKALKIAFQRQRNT